MWRVEGGGWSVEGWCGGWMGAGGLWRGGVEGGGGRVVCGGVVWMVEGGGWSVEGGGGRVDCVTKKQNNNNSNNNNKTINKTTTTTKKQELCESRGGRPGLPVPNCP